MGIIDCNCEHQIIDIERRIKVLEGHLKICDPNKLLADCYSCMENNAITHDFSAWFMRNVVDQLNRLQLRKLE